MVPFFYHLSILLIIIASRANEVDFIETQDDQILNKVTHPQFLQRIRDKLVKLPGATNVEGVHVLQPQDDENPKRWFDLKLKGTGGKETTLRFRGDNLYAVGYQMQNSQQWLELSNKRNKKYISGSQFLTIQENYDGLVGAAGLKSQSQVSLTKSTLSKAVATLAVSNVRSKRTEAMIVIIRMVSETCRFDDTSTYFTTNFDQSLILFQSWMKDDLVLKWGKLSTIVIKAKKLSWLQVRNTDDKWSTNQDCCRLA